jgi:hypothetical protein
MTSSKINFGFIAILVLIVLNITIIFFFSRVVEKSKRIEKAYNYIEKRVSIDEHSIEQVIAYTESQYLYDDWKIRDSLFNMELNRNLLVVRVNYTDCKQCIDSLFSQLKYSLKILKPQQIVLCTKETKCRSLKIDLNNNNLSSLKIVSLPQCGIDIPLDDYGSSYFFYHY